MKLPIETERLVLREMAAEDWHALYAYNRAPEFHRYLPIDPPNEEATRGFVRMCMQRARERPRCHYDPVVEERTTSCIVGTIRLSLRKPGVGDLGYAIRPDRWGRGYATEAVAALLAAAHAGLALREVWATVDPDNAASCRVVDKLGFALRSGEAGFPVKPGRPASLVYVRRWGGKIPE